MHELKSAQLQCHATHVFLQDGSLVTPTPGFVVKTSAVKASPAVDGKPAVPAGGKVFINITSADAVAPMVTRQTLDKDGREQEALNIPLSMGPLRADQDKSGNDCSVLDVIVNPGVVADSVADSSGHFRHFVVELALQYSERKVCAESACFSLSLVL